MFDITHLAVCFAAVFCFASLVKGCPVESASRKTLATCTKCGTACNCGAVAAPTLCTCHERSQPDEDTASDGAVRVVRSVPTSATAHHILKRERRCSRRRSEPQGDSDILAASNPNDYEQPPAPANRKLREDIERRLAEIRTRIDAIRSLAFLGYINRRTSPLRRAQVVARSDPEDSTTEVSVPVTADKVLPGRDEDAIQSAVDNALVGTD